MHHNYWNMITLSPSKTCVSEWNVVTCKQSDSLTELCHSTVWHTLISTLIWSLSLRQTGPVVYHRPHLIIFGSRPWKEVMRLSNICQWEAWNVFIYPMSFDDVCVTIYPSYWVPGVIHVNFPPLATQLRGLLWPDPLISALSCPHPLCTGAQANQAPGWQETQNRG